MERSSTGVGVSRARQALLATSNVYEFAASLGTDRYLIEYLNGQHPSYNANVVNLVAALMLGYEVSHDCEVEAVPQLCSANVSLTHLSPLLPLHSN
jgi:hypothetical protein